MNSLLQLPLAIVQRTDIPCLQPAGYAVEVECMLYVISKDQSYCKVTQRRLGRTHVANAPRRVAFFAGCGDLVGLAVDAYIT